MSTFKDSSLGAGEGFPAGGIYNSSAPTLSDGQLSAHQLDQNGNLKVNVASGGTSGTQYTDGNTTPTHPVGTMPVFNNSGTISEVSASVGLPVQIVGGAGSGGTSATDGAAFTAGTSGLTPTGGVFNDSLTALTSGKEGTARMSAYRALHTNLRDASGNQLLGQATSSASVPVVLASDQSNVFGNTQYTEGSTISSSVGNTIFWKTASNVLKTLTPATPAPFAITDGGGTGYQAAVDSSGNVATKVASALPAGSNTIGAVTQSGSWSVTANIGTTNGLALDSSVNGLLLAQGSTTSGEKGALVQGAVTTSAPTYTTAQTSPLSLTTAGALRVDGSGATQPISGTITANAGTNLNTSALALESGGNLATIAGAISASKMQTTVTNSTLAVTQSGTWDVGLNAGTNAIGDVNLNPAARGGWSAYLANAVTTTVTVSGAAGKFGGYMLINLNSAPAYLQVFDTTGAVTLGTTTPTFVLPIPANGTAANGVAANLEISNGVSITNGIKVAATTTPTGSTTVSTGLTGAIWYK